MMNILALETSCDDTAIAVVNEEGNVLLSQRHSQTEHDKWGGVVPELAGRAHARDVVPLLKKTLATISLNEINAIAVTQGPGLQTSLLTGTTVASFVSLLAQKPIIPVDHIFGHISSVFLERKNVTETSFPAIVLTVSGGHTQIYYQESLTQYTCIGSTRDDAAGEAFDKVSRILGLGYPGGPPVSKHAEKGDPKSFPLPKIFLEKDSLDFSFSGLKSAVYRLHEGAQDQDNIHYKQNICASFQYTVGEIFAEKLQRALRQYPQSRSVHFVGGVSCNTYISEQLQEICTHHNTVFRTPKKPEYSTDNAAMIGMGAHFLYQKNREKYTEPYFIDGIARLGR